MRMQVILDSLFDHLGSVPIWGGKKGEFRDWTNASREAARKKNSPLRESHSPLRGSLTRGKFKKNLWDQGMNHLV